MAVNTLNILTIANEISNYTPLFIDWFSVNRLIHFSLNLGNDNDDNKDGDDDDDDDVDDDENDMP